MDRDFDKSCAGFYEDHDGSSERVMKENSIVVDETFEDFEIDEVEQQLLYCLQKYWGYKSFKEGQLDVCKCILAEKRDCFVSMATGSGKSLMFQLPAVAMREFGKPCITLVISPLLSLIEDQISALLSMNVPACSLSNFSMETMAMNGEAVIVYTTPEKLHMWQHNLGLLHQRFPILTVAIDESHCVSEWGHDFRVEYRTLGIIRDILGPDVPIMALTASATLVVEQDIINNLHLINPLVVKTGLNRPNLKYIVGKKSSVEDIIDIMYQYRRKQLLKSAQSQGIPISSLNTDLFPFATTLIYVNSKKMCEEVATSIVSSPLLQGIIVAYYHADMNMEERHRVHRGFLEDRTQVIVSTTAFGMGINKPDVRLVIHYGLALSLEGYYQQTGRAGRDGLRSYCHLLWSPQDVNINQHLMRDTFGRRGLDSIDIMQNYARGLMAQPCRRRAILTYFGESVDHLLPHKTCCDLCEQSIREREAATNSGADDAYEPRPKPSEIDKGMQQIEISLEVYMLLSTIAECGGYYGLTIPVSILLGHHHKAMERVSGYQNFTYFGQGIKYNADWWKALANDLAARNTQLIEVSRRFRANGYAYQCYAVSELGRAYLAGQSKYNKAFAATQQSTVGGGSYLLRQVYSPVVHQLVPLKFSSEFLRLHKAHLHSQYGAYAVAKQSYVSQQNLQSTVSGSSSSSLSRRSTTINSAGQRPASSYSKDGAATNFDTFEHHNTINREATASSTPSKDHTNSDGSPLTVPVPTSSQKVNVSAPAAVVMASAAELEGSIRSLRASVALQDNVAAYTLICNEEIEILMDHLQTMRQQRSLSQLTPAQLIQLLDWPTDHDTDNHAWNTNKQRRYSKAVFAEQLCSAILHTQRLASGAMDSAPTVNRDDAVVTDEQLFGSETVNVSISSSVQRAWSYDSGTGRHSTSLTSSVDRCASGAVAGMYPPSTPSFTKAHTVPGTCISNIKSNNKRPAVRLYVPNYDASPSTSSAAVVTSALLGLPGRELSIGTNTSPDNDFRALVDQDATDDENGHSNAALSRGISTTNTSNRAESSSYTKPKTIPSSSPSGVLERIERHNKRSNSPVEDVDDDATVDENEVLDARIVDAEGGKDEDDESSVEIHTAVRADPVYVYVDESDPDEDGGDMFFTAPDPSTQSIPSSGPTNRTTSNIVVKDEVYREDSENEGVGSQNRLPTVQLPSYPLQNGLLLKSEGLKPSPSPAERQETKDENHFLSSSSPSAMMLARTSSVSAINAVRKKTAGIAGKYTIYLTENVDHRDISLCV